MFKKLQLKVEYMKIQHSKRYVGIILAFVLSLTICTTALARVVITTTGYSIFEPPFTQAAGSVGVMIIPVEFANASFGDENATEKIDQIFRDGGFGDLPAMKEYYEKASYDSLYMDIVVQRSVYLDIEREAYEENPTQLVWDCLTAVMEREVSLTSFDENYDGFMDALFLVVAGDAPDQNSVWWPHTDTYYGGMETDEIYVGGCSFISYDLLTSESSIRQFSAIHEMGHLFGLPDLYQSATVSGTGANVMMDLSTGDQDCFSKMLLGWTKPQVTDKAGSFRISSESVSPDALIIAPENWDGNILSEYFMVEYVTPANNQRKQGLSSEGAVRIWHVDANTSTFTNDVSIDMYTNNNQNGPKLLSLAQPGKEWYHPGEAIEPSQLVWHDGTPSQIRIRVASMDGTNAVIEVKYNQTEDAGADAMENTDSVSSGSEGEPSTSEDATSVEESTVNTGSSDTSKDSDGDPTGSSAAENVEESSRIFSVSVDDNSKDHQVKGNVPIRELTPVTGISIGVAFIFCFLLLRASKRYKGKRNRYK